MAGLFVLPYHFKQSVFDAILFSLLPEDIMEGVIIKELSQFHDERGWLVEIYEDELDFRPVMSYLPCQTWRLARTARASLSVRLLLLTRQFQALPLGQPQGLTNLSAADVL
jgi:hypothetical protein